MTTHVKFNFEYDKQSLLELFNSSEKISVGTRLRAVLPSGASNYEIFQPFFAQFPFVPKHDLSLALVESTANSIPRSLESATGHIILPISGNSSLKIYEFKFSDPTSTWAYAIKSTDVLTTTMLNDIESTLKETVEIDSPIAVHGQTVTSGQTTGSISLVLNIPLSVQWDDVVTALSA
jgi:hypothetical protein